MTGRRLGVALLGSVLVLAACSSSSSKTTTASSTSNTTPASSGSGGTSSAAASTVPAATGTPIKIGLIGGFTGAESSSASQGATVGPAWQRYVNEQLGGINGHPVTVITADDGGDPVIAQAAEKKLVDQDKVSVIIISSDNLISAYVGDAIGKGITLISGPANTADWYTKPHMVVTATDILSGLNAQVSVAKSFGKATKFADVYCSEVAACAQANPPLQAAATKAVIKFTSISITVTATSYTAQCLQLQQQGVDYVQLNFAASAAAKFVQDCAQQGYKPTYGSSAQAIGKDLLAIPGLKLFGPAYAFPSVADAAAAKLYRDAMTTFAKDNNWHDGSASFTWAGLELLRKALAAAPAGNAPVGPVDVETALNSIKAENLNGLLANKITITGGKTGTFGSQPCYFVIGIDGGKTTAPTNLDPQCPS